MSQLRSGCARRLRPLARRHLLHVIPIAAATLLVWGCAPPALRIASGYERWPWHPEASFSATDQVALSPLGTHAAIASADGSLQVIARFPSRGSAALTLAPSGVVPQFWADVSPWSRDGRALVYVQSGNVVYRHFSGEPRTLTTTADAFTAAISPDGRQVAFGRLGPQQQDLGLWIVSVEGGEPRQLVAPTGDVFHACCPHWSDDGQWVAFLQAYEGGALGVAAVDGSEVRTGVEAAWEPVRWLPGSHTILFARTIYGEGGDGLYSYDLTSDQARLLTAGGRQAAYALSPDGTRLLVASWLETSGGQVRDALAEIVTAATGAHEGAPVKLDGAAERCLWAPDARQKAILIRTPGAQATLSYTADDLAQLKPKWPNVTAADWVRVWQPPWWQFWR